MPVTRRTMIATPLVASGLMLPAKMFAQGTPEATPEGEPLPPEVIFDRLLTSEITTPLFPSDTAALTVEEWVDPNDTDLDNAIGGVMVLAGEGDDAQPIGAYIVHPTIEAAELQVAPEGSDDDVTLFGYPFGWTSIPSSPSEAPASSNTSFALLAVSSGPVIASAIGQGMDSPDNEFRAMANLAGLLAHLNDVTSAQ